MPEQIPMKLLTSLELLPFCRAVTGKISAGSGGKVSLGLVRLDEFIQAGDCKAPLGDLDL